MSEKNGQIHKNLNGEIIEISSVFADKLMEGLSVVKETAKLPEKRLGGKSQALIISHIKALSLDLPPLAVGVHTNPYKEFKRCYASLIQRHIKSFEQCDVLSWSTQDLLMKGFTSSHDLYFHWFMCEIAASKGCLTESTHIFNISEWEVDEDGYVRANDGTLSGKAEEFILYFYSEVFPAALV